jgi:hypothetical protein
MSRQAFLGPRAFAFKGATAPGVGADHGVAPCESWGVTRANAGVQAAAADIRRPGRARSTNDGGFDPDAGFRRHDNGGSRRPAKPRALPAEANGVTDPAKVGGPMSRSTG